ncbi:glycosyltransferase family 4 protein [Sphingobacterium sp. UBA5996]|uniref:glycosyltransferase family 4 protein n=1 Tax=Sphingobacterium sp. UBA5996 TaxID=1947505 RepID=UPI0025EE4808|nr:glycosyltransferase family 4 protein [Sphingobacterium sp. UBA5996]
MKKILYLTFYFEPDLCAGSFRNSPLLKELAAQAQGKATIDVITTLPNRYGSFEAQAPEFESRDNYTVTRVAIPKHQSGMKDQILSFKAYYQHVKKLVKGKQYDLVIASSSRLFTAYLGYTIAKRIKAPLYLDIRDIFYDTLQDVLQSGLVKGFALPVIKQIEKRTFAYADHINLISAGFKSYFNSYTTTNFTFYTNGIDDMFLENKANENAVANHPKKILYAGNLGEGQGLDKIVPDAAKKLGDDYEFIIVGDGGIKNRLIEKVQAYNLKNVKFLPPVKRDELLKMYEECDFTFVHLNDYDAFKKVLPSKIFELACFPQPIIAGVGGYANSFISENIENKILFNPCDVDDMVKQLQSYSYQRIRRQNFIDKFKRTSINKEMASSMLKYL